MRKPRKAPAATARKPKAPSAPAAAPTPHVEPETEPEAHSEPEDFAAIVEAEQARPRLNDEGQVEIECIIHNVHLGDGRQMNLGERACVRADIAALLVDKGQAAYVG